MLHNDRVKEAQANVGRYLEEGLLRLTAKDSNALGVLTGNAKESLEVAELLDSQNRSSLWTIVCSYYAMYYTANAVLLSLGYKVGEKIAHKVTADALIVYVRKKLSQNLLESFETAREEALPLAGVRADALIETLDQERAKRGALQYSTTEVAKHAKAQTSLKRAKEFVDALRRMITYPT